MLDHAVSCLYSGLFAAAQVAGMRICQISVTKGLPKKHQPWFESECKEARQALQGVSPHREHSAFPERRGLV
jgi:hypothetical protein